MNKDQVKGKVRDVKGDIKERVGGLRKDPDQQAEGVVDQISGKVQKAYGDLKDKFTK